MIDYYGENYNDQNYKGLQGIIMSLSHSLLERGISAELNKNVLEVGGGALPHLGWMKFPTVEAKYTISDSAKSVNSLSSSLVSKSMSPKIYFHNFEEDNQLEQFSGSQFSRVIASFVWEHVKDPEASLIKWTELLEEDGVLSISIPCDPGLLWRIGQRVAARSFMKTHKVSFQEYDLVMAREHINAAQRLLKILNYYFSEYDVFYFPFLVPIVETNLFITINAKKRNYRFRRN